MKAIVISETYSRFQRTAQVLAHANITEVIHSPAIFVPHTGNCTGTNGHRLAFRNAWNIITITNTPMLIFEDDVVLLDKTFTLRNVKTDLHDFGWCGSGFWCNHATYTSVRAASILFMLTEKCLGYRKGIDFITSELCGSVHFTGRLSPLHYTNRRHNITCSREEHSKFSQDKKIGVYHKKASKFAAIPLGESNDPRWYSSN